MKRTTLIAVLAVAAAALVGVFATSVYAIPSNGTPCVKSGCHATSPAGDPSGGTTGTPAPTVIPTDTPDATAAVTVCDSVSQYYGNAVVKLTATDSAPGWGVAYIYYKLDTTGAATLVRVPANYRSFEATIPVAALKSGPATHRLEYWSQDNSGLVEGHNVATFTVSPMIATSTSLKLSAKTLTRNHYLTLTGKLSGGTFSNTYIRFEYRKSTSSSYSLLKSVKVSSTGAATYKYKITKAGTYYYRLKYVGGGKYLPAPTKSGVKLVVK